MAATTAGESGKPKGSRVRKDESPLGIVIKLIVLAVVVGFLFYTGWQLVRDGSVAFAAAFFITAFMLVFVFMRKTTVPLRWIAPGLVFLILFQLYPIFFTFTTAFTNYSTGRNVTKPIAIEAIEDLTYVPEGAADLELDAAPGRGWQLGDLGRRAHQRPGLSGGAERGTDSCV